MPYGDYTLEITFTGAGDYKQACIGYFAVEGMPIIMPKAEDVTISKAEAGEKAEGSYVYQTYTKEIEGVENYDEENSAYAWYLSDEAGSLGTKVSDELEYTPDSADLGKYLTFSVTPSNKMGTSGLEAFSKQEVISRPTGKLSYTASVSGDKVNATIKNAGNIEAPVMLAAVKYTVDNGIKSMDKFSIFSKIVKGGENEDASLDYEDGMSVFAFCADTLEALTKE